jgi:DNA repair protein RadC
MEKLTIRAWAEEDRPREKLLLQTKQVLTDAELLAIILGTGSRTHSAVALGQELLGRAGNDLNELAKLSVADILEMEINGIGKAKAVSIVAAMELSRRRQHALYKEKTKVTGSRDIARIMQPRLADHPHEEFWVIYLNRGHRIISEERISVGGLSGTVADIRLIFKQAVSNLASAIIACHNHPSGNLEPSQADIQLTRRLKKAGQLLEVNLLDHLIVAESGFYSFADEGVL